MADRDVETIRSRAKFVQTLRRVADSIERAEPVRIQVAGKRLIIPDGALRSVEHEAAGGEEELELQLRWRSEGAAPERGKPRAAKAAPKARKRKLARRA
jgi:amphi-Trp domain-containing protein